jgi:ankyrin repeat protein
MEFLIRSGAPVNKVETDGDFPLMWALYSNCDFRVFNALIEAGADVNKLDS